MKFFKVGVLLAVLLCFSVTINAEVVDYWIDKTENGQRSQIVKDVFDDEGFAQAESAAAEAEAEFLAQNPEPYIVVQEEYNSEVAALDDQYNADMQAIWDQQGALTAEDQQLASDYDLLEDQKSILTSSVPDPADYATPEEYDAAYATYEADLQAIEDQQAIIQAERDALMLEQDALSSQETQVYSDHQAALDALVVTYPTDPADVEGQAEWEAEYAALQAEYPEFSEFKTTSEGRLSVLDPVEQTDAANKRYVDEGDARTLKAANTYTDQQVELGVQRSMDYTDKKFDEAVNQSRAYTDKQIKDLDRRLSAGIAASAAMPSVPTLRAGQSSLSVGVGHYNNEEAIGISTAKAISNTVRLDAGVAASTYQPERPVVRGSVSWIF
jgi:hypothetical protein